MTHVLPHNVNILITTHDNYDATRGNKTHFLQHLAFGKTNMVVHGILFLLCCAYCAFGQEFYSVYRGQCYSWSYADSFFIKENSLDLSTVLDQVESRSFVECCTVCDVSQGCSGVAFRDGECSLINGTAATASFVVTDGSGEDYKVMIYGSEHNQQVSKRATFCHSTEIYDCHQIYCYRFLQKNKPPKKTPT